MDAALSTALHSGPRTGAELRNVLGVSQPTLSRLLGQSRRDIAVLGRSRATRYALYRRIRELPPELPVHRVSASGEVRRIASLITITPERYWFEDLERPSVSREFSSLPWFVTDMRPQGYLGRLFPLRYEDLALPDRIIDWNEDHAIYALARRGEDLAGNLIIGEESLARWLALASGAARFDEAHRLSRYEQLAQDTLAGRVAGSSAAGEQPKFTAEVGASGQHARHVLVKFSPPLDTPTGQRWSDLLAAEHLAAEVLRADGHAAAHSQFLSDGRRAYLEIARFDRIGVAGRLGLVSIGALDDEFVGERLGWSQSAAALLRAGLIGAEDARELRWRSAFGSLIANTDMHLGNASFLYEGRMRFRLAPSYDMLPMMYAPIREEVSSREFMLPTPAPSCADQWRFAAPAARAFWETVSADVRISPVFRETAARNAALIEPASAR
ncbi:MAG: type II toxin-antitoxin system HipA family toxin YjjJ [Steroidobacter sp.]